MYIPVPGKEMPERGNALSRWVGRMLMRVMRWHVEGNLHHSPKLVCVMAPHTSWWDFTTNFAILLAMGLDASWFIANNYTKGIAGKILAYFGAVQVERGQRSDMVGQMVREFERRDKLVLGIYPEGTRKPVSRWKTGFWHIAKQAKVPVQLVAVDYKKRTTIFGPVIELGDDVDKDIQQMQEYFRPVTARHPQNVNW